MVCHVGIWHSTWHTTFARSSRLGKYSVRFWPPTLLGWTRRTMHTGLAARERRHPEFLGKAQTNVTSEWRAFTLGAQAMTLFEWAGC